MLRNLFVFLGLFIFLSIPTFFVGRAQVKEVALEFPREMSQRGLASLSEGEPSFDKCRPQQKWRYRCDQNRENCVKDKLLTYFECEK